MHLSPDNTAPLFQQVADALRAQVAAGVYRHDEPVPSIRALAVQLRINPNTIARAYEHLEREGVLESRKGLGMFVRAAAGDSARARTEDAVRATFQQGIHQARSAGLSKRAVDALYRDAWSDTRPPREEP